LASKKITVILVGVAVIVAGGFGIYLLTNDEQASAPATNQTPSSTATETPQGQNQTDSKTITVAEVQKHASKDDCWTIVENRVFDITSYVPRHPGGDEILQACGKDGTSLFTQRKTSDGQSVGSGTPHSSSATRQLEQFQIGILQ
jgi:cytochrome b involved in lipid metabolism